MLSPYNYTPREPEAYNRHSFYDSQAKKNSLATTASTNTTLSLNSNTFTNPDDFITYIVPDFNAVKYFQKDFVTSNEFYLQEETEVNGFELYLVEQWVINRNIGTAVTTFTGNELSKISAIRFTVIKKPTKYYPIRFQEYLNEIIQNHSKMKTVDKVDRERPSVATESRANSTNELLIVSKLTNKPPLLKREKATLELANEVCFVTNLASLPSNLNLIPVPDGDVRKLEAPFMINYDLKKLHCTGRSMSLTTEKITDASEGKFRQMYVVYNVKIPVKFAVRELVNIIQTCLFYFDLLDGRYCTGLLCIKTEEAITNWWNLIGLPHFNIKPDSLNGILPPRTVAAIISLLLSIRLRLIILGVSDVPKDPFDFEAFMLAIGMFQRQYKIEKSRKLDMQTLNKLFTTTNLKLMPEKGSNYFYSSPYGPEEIGTQSEYDFMANPMITPSTNELGSRTSFNTPTMSKRLYGKRELKKMANVMKNTVQDHISAAASTRDNDDPGSSSKVTGGRIRNRIAKLADTASPLDVETLELGNLVQNNLAGRTLIRLFHGINSGGAFLMHDADFRGGRHHKVNDLLTSAPSTSTSTSAAAVAAATSAATTSTAAPTTSTSTATAAATTAGTGTGTGTAATTTPTTNARNGKHSNDGQSYLYSFESLRDKIIQNNNTQLNPDNSKYSLGFSKKFGLPSKKGVNEINPSSSHLEVSKFDAKRSMQSSSMVDSFLRLGDHFAENTGSDASRKSIDSHRVKQKQIPDTPSTQFIRDLNRRNSWPLLLNKNEISLNTSIQFKNETKVNPAKVSASRDKAMKKSFSTSQISQISSSGFGTTDTAMAATHATTTEQTTLVTISKFVNTYLANINKLMKYENLRNHYFLNDNKEELSNVALAKLFQLLNVDLMKVKNMKGHLLNNKRRVMEEGLADNLEYNLNTLSNNVDRLSYEARIVSKKLRETEDNFKVYEMKLKEDCQKKILNIVDQVLKSRDFKEVYPNIEERRQIAFKLTGDANYANFDSDDERMSPVRYIVVLIYDIFICILLFVKFEKTHMNLARIRNSWARVDPSKKFINRTYSYLGRRPSSDSVAISDMNEK